MQLHKLSVRILLATLAVSVTQYATSTDKQLATHALTTDNWVAEQSGLQTAQLQTIQPKPPSNQAKQAFFSHPPRILRVAASATGAFASSTYEFTLTVPKDAGQPLKAVTIAQAENVEVAKFDVRNSKASLGERFASRSEIRLASTGGQPARPGEITLVFDQPVQPGSTVTVALAVQRNPSWGGVYEFGVTVYPIGENALGQFLGYRRINFYSR
ncbi:DUF2808 domain-containing protein [Leptolyngbya sp. NIES-2104]|uniref:DUF2808 domain-containing protein n=1 Tax=Leptolyngbya sp. NIES-2104 TaxID=1552121 RepID=UPI0006EC6BB9|nr:DUF2808 domain-containing protein [Leptolyngbya sp. NIES-2104]GAP99900.1 hypothetical protein NIES2104_64660 [Leptolyngbya sp. NIES-2104]